MMTIVPFFPPNFAILAFAAHIRFPGYSLGVAIA